MDKKLIGIGLFSAALLAGLAGALVTQKKANDQLLRQLNEANRTVGASKTVADNSRENAQRLEKNVVLLTSVLSNSTERLSEAAAKLKALENASLEKTVAPSAGTNAPAPDPALLAQWMAQVPAPTISFSTNRAGSLIRLVHFETLAGASGHVLAQNVDYGDIYGRRVVFRHEGVAPLAFDVTELHPGVLAYLKIDPNAALAKQAEIDEKNRLLDAINQTNLVIRRVAEQKAYEAAQAAELERARQEEAKRQAQVQQGLLARQIENNRLQAEAALRSATINAQTPPWLINPGVVVVPGRLSPGSLPTPPSQPTPPSPPTAPTLPTRPTPGSQPSPPSKTTPPSLPTAPTPPTQPTPPRPLTGAN